MKCNARIIFLITKFARNARVEEHLGRRRREKAQRRLFLARTNCDKTVKHAATHVKYVSIAHPASIDVWAIFQVSRVLFFTELVAVTLEVEG